MRKNRRVAAVLPCYKTKQHVLKVIGAIGDEVDHIIVVDDLCPQKTGNFVETACPDRRVIVEYHEENQGVGGAMITGYRRALKLNADIIVKIDSDGQMDPGLIPFLINPIIREIADYAKGNRFFNIEDAKDMPLLRYLGNAGLSFFTKLSSGYWNIFDPTNGFTAIERRALELIPLEKLNKRFFFESDVLFRLNIARAVVVDVPMKAVYGNEKSNLSVSKILFEFPYRHLKVMTKRVLYSYFIRDFSIASLHFIFGSMLLAFGLLVGLQEWHDSMTHADAATSGTVMLSALPIIIGFQLLLAFLSQDIQSVPQVPLSVLTKSIETPRCPTPDRENAK